MFWAPRRPNKNDKHAEKRHVGAEPLQTEVYPLEPAQGRAKSNLHNLRIAQKESATKKFENIKIALKDP